MWSRPRSRSCMHAYTHTEDKGSYHHFIRVVRNPVGRTHVHFHIHCSFVNLKAKAKTGTSIWNLRWLVFLFFLWQMYTQLRHKCSCSSPCLRACTVTHLHRAHVILDYFPSAPDADLFGFGKINIETFFCFFSLLQEWWAHTGYFGFGWLLRVWTLPDAQLIYQTWTHGGAVSHYRSGGEMTTEAPVSVLTQARR